MPKRRLPTCPDIGYLKREAKELLGEYRREKRDAIADFGTFHPIGVKPREASLSDAQIVLARSYRFVSWARLKLAAELCRAIYESDAAEVVSLVERHPELLHEPVRGADTGASWGTPVACARFFGRNEVVDQLVKFIGNEADEVFKQAEAVGRQQLSDWFIGPDGRVKAGAVMNPCETLNGDGLEFLIEQGIGMIARTQNGRFAKGNGGGPDRPKRSVEVDYLKALNRTVTLADWKQIIRRAVMDAVAGDAKARNWLSKYLLPSKIELPPRQEPQESAVPLAYFEEPSQQEMEDTLEVLSELGLLETMVRGDGSSA